MEKTPISLRTHVAIFGNTNAGKSALFNALTEQDAVIVSHKPGTTTDPVIKAMELIPYGPIALIDTAGFGDTSEIGAERMKKSEKILNRTDFAVYAAPSDDFDRNAYSEAKKIFELKKIPHLLVFTKSDLTNDNPSVNYPDAVSVSVYNSESVENLKKELIKHLPDNTCGQTMIGNLLPYGSTVAAVIPIDGEAPKGRLILPQVQFIRDCLDHGIKTISVRDTELKDTLREFKGIELVVTDSQVFKTVSEIVPDNIHLTSFSMLSANMKGDLKKFIDGAAAIENLKNGSRILMAEACTHNSSHEDIGRVKIPALLKKYTQKDLSFDFCVNNDFPDNIIEYDLVIHCGGCMITKKSMCARIDVCSENGIPITNYGVVLAYVNGILDRSKEIFNL